MFKFTILLASLLIFGNGHMYMNRGCNGCSSDPRACSENSRFKFWDNPFSPNGGDVAEDHPSFIKINGNKFESRACKGIKFDTKDNYRLTITQPNFCGNIQNMVRHGYYDDQKTICTIKVHKFSVLEPNVEKNNNIYSNDLVESTTLGEKCLHNYDARKSGDLFGDPGNRGDTQFLYRISKDVCRAC